MSNQGMSCLFHSCLFTVISVGLSADIIFFPSAVESTLMYCCFNDDVCYAFYGSGSGNCWCVASSSINSTVCMNSNTNQAPWTGGIDKFTFFFDNHTYLTSLSIRSCYTVQRIPVNRDDINCFFSGTSCSGPYPVDLWSDVSGCILSKFNFVNNTDSLGYFRFVLQGISTLIRDTVISFNTRSASARWVYSAQSNTCVIIENSFIIAFGPIPEDSRVITVNIQCKTYAPTFHAFRDYPPYKECFKASQIFSYSNYYRHLFPCVASLTVLLLLLIH